MSTATTIVCLAAKERSVACCVLLSAAAAVTSVAVKKSLGWLNNNCLPFCGPSSHATRDNRLISDYVIYFMIQCK